jgi:hypothetical protein
LLPFLALLGARLLAELFRLARRPFWRGGVAGLITAVATASILYSAAYLNIYSHEDSRVEASRWIHANIPQNATVLLDISYGSPLLGTMFFQPNFYDAYTPGFGLDYYVKKDYFTIKTLNLFTYASQVLVSSAKFREYARERLENVEYILISNEHYEQFLRRAHEYPAVVRFLTNLFSENMGFRRLREFRSYPSIFGLTIKDDRSELSFRLFDHPQVLIFKRETSPREVTAR